MLKEEKKNNLKRTTNRPRRRPNMEWLDSVREDLRRKDKFEKGCWRLRRM